MIDIENVPEWAFSTHKPLRCFIPGGEHYAICNNCGLLHFKAIEVTEDENAISEEAPICDECQEINDAITRIALHQ